MLYGLLAWNTGNLNKISEVQKAILHSATEGFYNPAVRNLEL